LLVDKKRQGLFALESTLRVVKMRHVAKKQLLPVFAAVVFILQRQKQGENLAL
jgi:hypothetical protein